MGPSIALRRAFGGPVCNYLQPRLVLWQNLHILIRQPQEFPHVPPAIAPKERLRLARLVVLDPEPRRPKRAVLFVQLLRRLRERLLVLGRLGSGHDVDDLRLGEVFVQGLCHVGWDGDVDELDEAVIPEREVGELVLFLGEGVLDVDHAALRLWVDVSGERWRSVGRA